jgi:predicted amidohydrolase YtcJ
MSSHNETLFVNGRFVDPSAGSSPLGDGLLSRAGIIVYVGGQAQARAQAAPSAQKINLDGRTAVPGFVDAHVHLQSLGAVLSQCDLSGTASRREALDRIAAFAQAHPSAAWVRARGYNLNTWDDPAYPTARQLDEAVSDRPCVAVSFDGHSAWANSAALAAAGLDQAATDPEGGRVLRDARSRPTGCLLEAATGLIYRAIPPEPDEVTDEQLRQAVEEMARRGHTGVHALASEEPAATLERIQRLYPGGRCPIRIRLFGSFDSLDKIAAASTQAHAADRVKLTGVKCLLDGSLGSRTAWLFEPFTDDPSNRGIPVLATEELRRRIETTNSAGIPLICHAIGDRACAEALRTFGDGGDAGAGNRIEHAQILRAEDLDLFARAGVAASVQPGHLWTDWRPSDRLLGPQRARRSYAFRSLLDHGAVLAMGSDAPVVPPDLQASLHAAVTRTDADGQPAGGWHAEECITPLEWAAAASHGAWRSIGQADQLGWLQPGMACDLTVLSEDILAAGFSDYLNWQADATVVAGELRFCT